MNQIPSIEPIYTGTPLNFWFDFASTYSYPAAMRIGKLAASRGVSISWRPFLLGPIFAAQGWTDSPFNLYPEKGRYMWRDLERLCNAEEIAFRRPSQFPRNSLLAARVACRYSDAPWLPDFVRAVYGANFAHVHAPQSAAFRRREFHRADPFDQQLAGFALRSGERE